MEAPVAADELEAIGALGALAFAANTARYGAATLPTVPVLLPASALTGGQQMAVPSFRPQANIRTCASFATSAPLQAEPSAEMGAVLQVRQVAPGALHTDR